MSDRHERIVAGSGVDAVVMVHVGLNDVGRVRSEELLRRQGASWSVEGECQEIHPVWCAVQGQGWREWTSRVMGLNRRVKALCEDMGGRGQFLDGWDNFWGLGKLFAVD